MSQESPERLIRSFYEAFNRKDFAAVEPVAAEDITVEETPGFNPEARVYHGVSEARRYFDGWFKFWEAVNAEVLNIAYGSGGRMAVQVRVTVVGRGSDLEVADEWGHVVEIRDGKISRFTLFRSPEEAIKAAALAE